MSSSSSHSPALTLALSKGRIFTETLPLLKAAGIELLDDPNASRKLILSTNRPDLNLVIVRASDVPTYVQYGAAALGVAGKDVLLEHGGEGVYEPLDLRIAKCRLMVAGAANALEQTGRLRVATKYVNTTQTYFAKQGRQVEVIKLYGSMELAPLAGLADCIVDVVDTGRTLHENGLQPLLLIASISSRLIVNKAAMKMQHGAIIELLHALTEAVAVTVDDHHSEDICHA